MQMVKLPNLDTAEVQWIIQAMEHYYPQFREVQSNNVDRFEQLVETLKRRAMLTQD
jgi:hypothetical protein